MSSLFDSHMVSNILLVLVFILAPAGVMALCRKVTWIGKIGPVLVLYVLGIIVGNVWNLPFMPQKPDGMAGIQDALSSAMVPLAIPLMLFGCTFRKSETRSQVLALVTGMIAVVIAVIAGYLIFGTRIEDGAKIGGMLTGVYTGGTINLASLKTMLDVPDETFILLNSYDMVISFLFLTFLIAAGIKLFRKLLPDETSRMASTGDDKAALKEMTKSDDNPYLPLKTRSGWKDAGIVLAATAVITGISAGVALLLPDGWFMTAFILLLTTLSIAASFIKVLREKKIAEPLGMYFIYIFSIVVASMADLSKLDISGGINMLLYLTFIIFGSLAIQLVFSMILRIDADTTVIASTAFICSPPFVPMMAAAMKNRRVLVAGLSIGIVGYAAGNYLGFLIYRLLELL